jgi:hypothetical protein
MPFPPDLGVPVLEGRLVRLEPLRPHHATDLTAAASEDRGSYRFTWVPSAGEVSGYLAEQTTRPGLMPFAQVSSASGRAVGVTAYWEPRRWLPGPTWNPASPTAEREPARPLIGARRSRGCGRAVGGAGARTSGGRVPDGRVTG